MRDEPSLIHTHDMKKTYYELITEFADYEPKSRWQTSKKEMDRINEHFGLEEMSAYELCNLRDMVVLVYEGMRDKMRAMMSITAVIDYYKVNKGVEA